MPTKKVKKKLNIKGLILIILIIYIIVMVAYTIFSMPIKNIYIYNTNLISDNTIIEKAGIKDYPSIFKVNTKKVKESILTIPLVSDVIVKKTIFGKISIDITEAIPLFYNRNTSKIILSNGNSVDDDSLYLGVPTLVNRVPNDLLQGFIKSFSKVDPDIIKMINEIVYDPDIKDDITLDDSRFFLRMNDGNHVYVNIINMQRLNNYKKFYMLVNDKKGILYLDSYDASDDLVGLFTEFNDGKN